MIVVSKSSFWMLLKDAYSRWMQCQAFMIRVRVGEYRCRKNNSSAYTRTFTIECIIPLIHTIDHKAKSFWMLLHQGSPCYVKEKYGKVERAKKKSGACVPFYAIGCWNSTTTRPPASQPTHRISGEGLLCVPPLQQRQQDGMFTMRPQLV